MVKTPETAKPLKAPPELMDAAWVYIKENYVHWASGAKRAMAAELGEDFPHARGPQLRHAVFMAKSLFDACYAVGDKCRAEILTREQAEAHLATEFPGFSPDIYARAVSYGWFISR